MEEYSWKKFPYADSAYLYEGDALKGHWESLHEGDKEPFPHAKYLEGVCEKHPKVKQTLPSTFQSDYEALATELQQAWRFYHQGEFQQAAKLGFSLGLIGYYAALRAQAIYANYLESNESRKRHLLEDVAKQAETVIAVVPEYVNAYYIHAYTLGRYSQSISVVKALAQGIGSKVKGSLDMALKLEPNHSEAHTASGTYHSEIIDKVGSLVGSVTYGAKKELGLEHFEKALELTPEIPGSHIEYANGLLMMFGKKKLQEATNEYDIASESKARDAMERLDVEVAKSKFE